LVLRADNRGEGGILALLALLNPWRTLGQGRTAAWVMALGVFGAALLYCDGMITPAISVLSAVEGLKIATPAAGPFVVPLTLVILAILFALQRFGTARVGTVFGPVMLLWFATLAILGLKGISHNPGVLVALNPWYGLNFLLSEGKTALLVLGGVFLVVTGAEALYADLGHFGRRPIRQAWFVLVLPALVLNYLG
ncbi:MAG TPA: potassium transporter Kup, partial [Gammaproteobacteria bacterium]|nr:potassium transporter Kup [Gammaproteobacteria bacterium]